MAVRTYEQIEEQKYSAFGNPKLSFEHKLAIYGRQSTKEQVEKNHGAYLQQAVKLVDMGKELGFTGTGDIIVFIENKSRNGKWVNASGRLRIDQRPGLSALVELIEKGVVKTVLVWTIDRLFRDEDMIQPAVFVKICKDHHVIVLTVDDFFDFNNPKRDDGRRFRELAQAAADYITKHVAKMHDAQHDAARRGEYDGRGIPIGYYLPRGAAIYVIFALYAPIIRWLFKKFREVNGNIHLLCQEIARKEYLFPFPPEGMEAPFMRITKLKNGYTISRSGLKGILTNTAYLGWWYFKQSGKSTVIIKNHHPALIDGVSVDIEGDVVTEEDFWYAFNMLSPTTIDGIPLEACDRPKKAPTHRPKTDPYPALLEEVISSVDHPVYVIQNIKRGATYNISNAWRGRALSSEHDSHSTHIASIAVKSVDAAFVSLVKFRLRYFQAFDMLLDKIGQEQREKSMYQHLKEVQEQIVNSNVSVDEQIRKTKRKISRLERILDVAEKAKEEEDEELDEKTILNSLKSLRRLRKTLAELEVKKNKAQATDEDLKDIAKKLTDAAQGFDALTFDRQKMFVELAVRKATLTQVTPRWMQLDIEWAPFLGFNFIDRGYIFNLRGRPPEWSGEDRAKLKEIYLTSDRDTILRTFPTRTWSSIYNQASDMNLSGRPKNMSNNSPLPIWMSYEDMEVIDLFSLDLGEYFKSRPERHFDWKVLVFHENDTSAYAAVLIFLVRAGECWSRAAS